MELMQAQLQSTSQAAERLAIQALTFIAADLELLRRFLGITGIAPQRIRTAAREPGFIAGVLEPMLSEENLLLAFGRRCRD